MSKSTRSAAVVTATEERIEMLEEITPIKGSVSDSEVERQGERSQTYEWTSKINREDKQSGSYECYTMKEKASGGELQVEKATGGVGVKDEFQKSTAIKFDNKDGFREYHIEERFRDINFGKSNNEEQGPKKYITACSNKQKSRVITNLSQIKGITNLSQIKSITNLSQISDLHLTNLSQIKGVTNLSQIKGVNLLQSRGLKNTSQSRVLTNTTKSRVLKITTKSRVCQVSLCAFTVVGPSK